MVHTKKYIQIKCAIRTVKNVKIKTYICHITFYRKVQAEHEQSITINITLCKFRTSTCYVTIIDVKEQYDFIKNIITRTSQRDVGVLNVVSIIGEF